MQILQLNNITLHGGAKAIFENLSWELNERERIGLIGPNGAGKSSLLKLINGEVEASSGSINIPRNVTIGYLPQDVSLTAGLTLLEEAMILSPEVQAVDLELKAIEEKLTDPAVHNDMDRLSRWLHKQETALAAFEQLGGFRHRSLIEELLSMLGFSPADYDLPIEALSGGQKKLVLLCRIAARLPSMLLLDEPDNHLDLSAKRKLESFIRGYDGAVVIVSHDRYLLDEVVTGIAELENGRLTIFHGNYSAYANERELRRLRQQQLYVTQQKQIDQIEAAIKRFEHWAHITEDPRHIRQARSRQRMLQRMDEQGEMMEAVREAKEMNLDLKGWRGSTLALQLKNLAMGFGNELLFVGLDMVVRHGERVGLIGGNGAGKSVLMRLVRGEFEPIDGEIVIGPSTKVGYYAQEHQTLNDWLNRTPIEFVRDSVAKSEGEAVALLTKFLFDYDQCRAPIKNLSGGERSRLQLAGLMLEKPNLLLFDEPTNNLDILSIEVLESTLETFNGAMLIISHDRYFLDRVVDRVVVLENSDLTHFEGGYSAYLEQIERAEH